MKQYKIEYPETTPSDIISAWEVILKNINTTGELNGIKFPEDFGIFCDDQHIDFEPIEFTQEELVAIYTVFGAMCGYDNIAVSNNSTIDVYGKIDRLFDEYEFVPEIADIRININLNT